MTYYVAINKTLWPPRSPDLTTSDCFLWGYLKSKVYKSNPHRIQELKDDISQSVAAIKITTLHLVYLNMIRRGQLCIDAGGNHFHYLLWWLIFSKFGYCIKFCIYAMLRTWDTFLWPILFICTSYRQKRFWNLEFMAQEPTAVTTHLLSKILRSSSKMHLPFIYQIDTQGNISLVTSNWSELTYSYVFIRSGNVQVSRSFSKEFWSTSLHPNRTKDLNTVNLICVWPCIISVGKVIYS